MNKFYYFARDFQLPLTLGATVGSYLNENPLWIFLFCSAYIGLFFVLLKYEKPLDK